MTIDQALPGELLSTPVITSRLLEVARYQVIRGLDSYRALLRTCGCRDADAMVEELRAVGFFQGGQNDATLSTRAYRALLFLSGALGAKSDEVFDELRALEPGVLQRYELVREGMTARFIKGLLTDPGFGRIYICSPWINLMNEDLGRLALALDKATRMQRRTPEMLVPAFLGT